MRDLGEVGFDVLLQDERADHRADHGVALFVAPHEFFVLGRGPLWRDPEILRTAFIVIDDPIGSTTLSQSLVAAIEAGGIIETSFIGAKIWTEAGIPTHRLDICPAARGRWLEPSDVAHPLLVAAPQGASSFDDSPLGVKPRPLDLVFFDQHSPRRKAALGRLATTLAMHRCYIYCRQPEEGKLEERARNVDNWRISGHLSACSRLTLSLAEASLPCLDRRRIVAQAMTSGSAVVSDVVFSEPGLKAGTHYLSDDTRHLGALIEWLLSDPDGRATVERTRRHAFERLTASDACARRLRGLRDFLLVEPCEVESEP